jgi:hypothetical protein
VGTATGAVRCLRPGPWALQGGSSRRRERPATCARALQGDLGADGNRRRPMRLASSRDAEPAELTADVVSAFVSFGTIRQRSDP